MQRVKRPLALLLLSTLLFSACDDVEKLDDVTFSASFTLPKPFEVSETGDAPDNPYESAVSTLAIEQDADVEKYKEKIENITVEEVGYTISELDADGPVTLEKGQIFFFATGAEPEDGVIASVTNVVLEEGSGTLQVDQNALNVIGKTLKDDGEVSLLCSATISDAPVSFKLGVTLKVKVTANALQ